MNARALIIYLSVHIMKLFSKECKHEDFIDITWEVQGNVCWSNIGYRHSLISQYHLEYFK